MLPIEATASPHGNDALAPGSSNFAGARPKGVKAFGRQCG